jgi:hypothetical protein
MSLSILAFTFAACAPGQDDPQARPTTVPDWAVEIAPDVYSLGRDFDPETGEEIEGFVIVDRMGDPEETEDLSAARRTTGCYADLGYGSWASAESWGYDATNSWGISSADFKSTIETSQGLWESASGGNIFGSYSSAFSGTTSTTADGQNNVVFGDAGGGSTVAVTYVWGTYWGKPSSRSIYEWDQIYEDSLPWTVGDPASSSSFDFLNVAAHEVGHAAGLGHPSNTCSSETMYAYVDYGETTKRDLNTGDIAGINTLY